MSSANEFQRLTLATGYVAFTVAVLAAWHQPAHSYEMDLYVATPLAFWIGTGLAALAGLWVATDRTVTSRIRTTALALPVLAVFAIAAIPLIRSFYFFGPGDSLSHLGWARMLAADQLSPLGLLYPGIHVVSVFVARVFDVALRRAMQYTVLVYTLLYVVFVPLAVRRITDSRWALVVGTALALLLLPINNVSVFHLPYPTAQAIFFIPFMLYLALRYLDLPDGSFPRSVTGTGLLLAIASVAVVLVHPQQAGSVLLVFGAVVAVQWLLRWRWPEHSVGRQRPFYAQFAILAVAFLLWTPRFDRPQSTTEGLVNGLLGAADVGDEVSARTGALEFLGGGVEELFVKIFGVALLLSIVAGFVILASFAGRISETRYDGTALQYLSVGHLLLTGTFLLFFLGSVSVFPFRYLGALMVLVTVIAAVGLDLVPAAPSWLSWRAVRPIAVVLVVALLAVQMAHVHESPYIYQPSDQVTEESMEGYESAFEHRDPEVWFAGIRGGPRRYVDATYGTTTTEVTPDGRVFPGKRSAIPFEVFGNNMTEYYDRDRYVPVTDRDVQQEVGLYRGYRYSLSGFRSLRTTPGIHRVRSNGDFRLYYVDQRE